MLAEVLGVAVVQPVALPQAVDEAVTVDVATLLALSKPLAVALAQGHALPEAALLPVPHALRLPERLPLTLSVGVSEEQRLNDWAAEAEGARVPERLVEVHAEVDGLPLALVDMQGVAVVHELKLEYELFEAVAHELALPPVGVALAGGLCEVTAEPQPLAELLGETEAQALALAAELAVASPLLVGRSAVALMLGVALLKGLSVCAAELVAAELLDAEAHSVRAAEALVDTDAEAEAQVVLDEEALLTLLPDACEPVGLGVAVGVAQAVGGATEALANAEALSHTDGLCTGDPVALCAAEVVRLAEVQTVTLPLIAALDVGRELCECRALCDRHAERVAEPPVPETEVEGDLVLLAQGEAVGEMRALGEEEGLLLKEGEDVALKVIAERVTWAVVEATTEGETVADRHCEALPLGDVVPVLQAEEHALCVALAQLDAAALPVPVGDTDSVRDCAPL